MPKMYMIAPYWGKRTAPVQVLLSGTDEFRPFYPQSLFLQSNHRIIEHKFSALGRAFNVVWVGVSNLALSEGGPYASEITKIMRWERIPHFFRAAWHALLSAWRAILFHSFLEPFFMENRLVNYASSLPKLQLNSDRMG